MINRNRCCRCLLLSKMHMRNHQGKGSAKEESTQAHQARWASEEQAGAGGGIDVLRSIMTSRPTSSSRIRRKAAALSETGQMKSSAPSGTRENMKEFKEQRGEVALRAAKYSKPEVDRNPTNQSRRKRDSSACWLLQMECESFQCTFEGLRTIDSLYTTIR